jgi:hypothetical protein
MKVEERATGADGFRRVSMSEQKYSVQYKGYNLIGSPLWKQAQQEVQQRWFIDS